MKLHEGNKASGGDTTYIKNCDCIDSTATVGAYRTKCTPNNDIDTNNMKSMAYGVQYGWHTIAIHYYPMPSCDKCGEPWIKEIK